MRTAILSLLALSALSCSHPAFASASEEAARGPTPLGNPGDWIGTEDYPAIALRLKLTGTTSFRLTVDATGKPIHCDIVQSSQFDVLDNATCQLLLANARFSPLHDRAGKPVEGFYANRVRWVLPDRTNIVSENFGSMLLSIDQTGKVTSCRLVVYVPTTAATPAEQPCGNAMQAPPQALAMELRGERSEPSVQVEIREAVVFTPELRAHVMSAVPGHEQRGLNVHHFTVTRDGTLGECEYEEQRGSDFLIFQFCWEASGQNFDPPFSAFGTDGIAHGWHIRRFLLKTEQSAAAEVHN